MSRGNAAFLAFDLPFVPGNIIFDGLHRSSKFVPDGIVTDFAQLYGLKILIA